MAEIKARPDPIQLTPSARRRIASILAAEARPGTRLRVSVSGGGCSGFRYGFALDDTTAPDDLEVHVEGAAVVVDGMSLLYVLGAELDFVEDLTGSYFQVRNPNAASSCGCGNSFAV
jgi:iron-sulfur cluster insertion protein